jgi:hypothetical protein
MKPNAHITFWIIVIFTPLCGYFLPLVRKNREVRRDYFPGGGGFVPPWTTDSEPDDEAILELGGGFVPPWTTNSEAGPRAKERKIMHLNRFFMLSSPKAQICAD